MVLLTGATGYIGGRLLPLLVRNGCRVRCLARRPDNLRARVPAGVEVARGDVLDPDSLAGAMRGVRVAYYLIHALGSSEGFEAQEREGAANFGRAASEARIERIVYLGGLGDDDRELSPHLRSRHAVGRILRDSGVPVVELRASVIIGSGSLSFEMIRALSERLPVMVTPRWVSVPTQPIGIGDTLEYLVAAADIPCGTGRIYEIGGPDRVSYGDLIREYMRQRGLRRLIVPVPVLTPRLSSLWLGLVTPLYARIGRKLIDSVRHPTVIRDDTALRDFDIRPVGYREAMAQALRNEDAEFAQTRWSDAVSASGEPHQWGGARFGNRLVDSRRIAVGCDDRAAFAAVESIGGRNGGGYADWLWTIRGWLDLLVGGVGMRRGRRDPDRLAVGDVVDCWRVEAIEPRRRLLLAAEMILPGRAWLQFEVVDNEGRVELHQTAMFDPVGLWGLAYWYAVWPLHQIVFRGMLRGLARRAVSAA
ncbi:MAG: SDR family oxidoreductase [Armatimonadetes bacterium]|nr:SDR family oxidoreductase [Armatimonadota bacterium]